MEWLLDNRSQVITLTDQLTTAVEDKVEQAGGAAVLFKHLLNPVKELSGKTEVPLITSTPAAAQVVREDELLQIETFRQLI